jgi:hypothetical protein
MDEQQLRWHALLRLEVEKRAAARAVLSANHSPRELSKVLQDWWKAIELALTMYRLALADERTLTPPPLDILANCSNVAGYLAVGQIPKTVADAASEGRRPPGPTEQRDIGFAVAYMLAASRDGIMHFGERIIIADETPIKTVCEAFGVKRSTAQGWKQKVKPAFLGLGPINGKILESRMRQAGGRYQREGRSASAITKRGPRN